MEIKNLTEAGKSIAQLKQELSEVRSKYSAFRRDNSIKSNTTVPPHLQNKLRKYVDTIAAINGQIKTATENDRSNEEKSDTVEFNQKLATRKDDKEASTIRKGKAQSEGNLNANEWVKKQGGYAGAAKALIKMAKNQTNNGQEAFDAQAAADSIGITKGSVLRWINSRDEFNGMKEYMQANTSTR